MSHYKSYPEYKESGAELIGNIPKDWELKRLRHVAIFNNSNVDKKSYDDQADVKLCNYTDVYYNEFITPELEFMNATASESEIDKFRLAEGDVIITKDSEDPNDIGIPALVKQDMHDVVCGYHLTVIKSHEFDLSGFIHRSIQSHPTKAHFFVESPGITRFGLDQDAIGDIPICIPPKEHRSTIVSAINTEINRINTLITKKTRVIELLKEKRQALITHAVTKGLNPHVKMKDSDVGWIGKIPEHWEVKPFFSLLTELKRKNTGLVETNILSLSYGRVIQKSENRNMGLVPESYETYQIVEQGEVVFRFTDLQNDKRSLRSALVQERGIISSAYMAVSLRNIDSNYFSWLMRSYDLCKVFYGMGGGVRQSLKFEDVRRLQVLVPPKEEQAEIAAHVDRQLAHNDSLVEKTERSINLLKERRSAFITAAVTGQIDLRGEPA